MKVIRDATSISTNSAEAIVITGDGSHEVHRIKAIAPKFNADRKLLFPHGTSATASRLSTIVGKQRPTDPDSRTGLPALDSIRDYHTQRSLRTRLRPDPAHRYLFISDTEDKDGGFRHAITDWLEKNADTRESVNIQNLDDRAFECQCLIGSLETRIYCAFIGDETGCFEDGLAKLLQMRKGRSISANDRDELKAILSNALGNSSGDDLLNEARKDEIQSAFPNLSACLREFED